MIGTEAALGQVVLKAEEFDAPEPTDTRSRSQEDQNYGFRLLTERGVLEVIYRNASNGYYGGSCGRVPEPKGITWLSLKADYSA